MTEKVIPEWVKIKNNGYKQLETIGIDALLVEAIKEQQKMIDSLQFQISGLTMANEKLKSNFLNQQSSINNLQSENSSLKTEVGKIKEYLELKSKK